MHNMLTMDSAEAKIQPPQRIVRIILHLIGPDGMVFGE